tara:strand:+ start:565 stop:1164 length:600 start_codon:yes stop_codon:yes gene_type:complete
MPFWTEAQDSTTSEPKRKYRFTVAFDGVTDPNGNGSVLWFAKTVSKPSFQLSTTEHKYLNHTFYYPGSVTWQTISLTMVDPVDPDMSITVARILEASGYSLPGNAVEQGSLATISKGQAVGALGVVTIVQYNALGEAIETWTLWNAFVTEAKFGDLEYGSDDLLQLDLTLQYDWARIEVEGKSALNGDSAQAAFNIAGS